MHSATSTILLNGCSNNFEVHWRFKSYLPTKIKLPDRTFVEPWLVLVSCLYIQKLFVVKKIYSFHFSWDILVETKSVLYQHQCAKFNIRSFYNCINYWVFVMYCTFNNIFLWQESSCVFNAKWYQIAMVFYAWNVSWKNLNIHVHCTLKQFLWTVT